MAIYVEKMEIVNMVCDSFKVMSGSIDSGEEGLEKAIKGESFFDEDLIDLDFWSKETPNF